MAKFKELETDFNCGKQLARKKWNEQDSRITTVIVKHNKKIQMQKNSTLKVENDVFPYKLTSSDRSSKDWYVVNPDESCGEGCGCVMTQEEAEKAQEKLEK